MCRPEQGLPVKAIQSGNRPTRRGSRCSYPSPPRSVPRLHNRALSAYTKLVVIAEWAEHVAAGLVLPRSEPGCFLPLRIFSAMASRSYPEHVHRFEENSCPLGCVLTAAASCAAGKAGTSAGDQGGEISTNTRPTDAIFGRAAVDRSTLFCWRGIIADGEWVGQSHRRESVRKVRTPQGRALAKGQAGQPDGKWHRNIPPGAAQSRKLGTGGAPHKGAAAVCGSWQG